MAIVNDIVTKFSFKGSLSQLEKYNSLLGESIKSIGKFTTGVFGLGSAFALFISKISLGNEELIQLSRTSKISIERIQQLQFAASQLGSSAEAVEGTLSSLSRTIGNAAQRGNEDFMRLGISVRDVNGHIKRADQILLDVSDRFRRFNLSSQEREDFASRLGIDRSLVQLLGATSKELTTLFDRANKLGVLSQKDSEALSRYNDSISELKFGLRSINNQIAVGFAPELKRLSNSFTEFLIKNREFIKTIAQNAGQVFISFGGAIKRLTGLVFDFGNALGVSRGAVIAIGAAIALLALPIETSTLLIGGLLLAVDDLIVGLRGGKSVLIDFFKSTGESIKNDFLNTFMLFKNALQDTAFAKGLIAAFNQLSAILEKIVTSLKSIVSIATNDSSLGKLAGAASRGVVSLGKFIANDFSENIGKIRSLDATGANSGLNLIKTSAVPVSQAAVNQNNIFNIQSSDPAETARLVGNTLQTQLTNANDQFRPSGGF